ncbi:translation initiation factor IF-2-like [Camelus ferus]|uniref:Translation initiation factor IF-2-like n=1 Tax=Camelus ferus TaxID=419612 RepID=A0A8B8S3F7_CAMFR|nr:translation initiation factor IF-2-like [Camelus ferus]
MDPRGNEYESSLEKPKSRGHPRLSLRLAGALAEPVSGGGSVASLHLEKALRAWPNAIRKCAAVSDLRRRLWAEGRRPVRALGPCAPRACSPQPSRGALLRPPAASRSPRPRPRRAPAPHSHLPLRARSSARGALGARDPLAKRPELPTPETTSCCQPAFYLKTLKPERPCERPGPGGRRGRVAPLCSEAHRPVRLAAASSPSPGERLPAPGRRAPSTHLAPQKCLGRAARAARARRTLRRGGQKPPRQHLVRNPGPGPSPTPASSPRRRSRRRLREVKWGWDGGCPASPAPSGRAERGAGRDPEAEGARRHLHRPASARRARAPARPRPDPAPSARAGGNRGTKGAREGPARAARSARGRGDGETRLERSSARFLEATPRPGPAARRGAKSRDCRRRHRRRRQARWGNSAAAPRASRGAPPQPEPGAGMPSPPPPPPRASTLPSRARAPTLLSQTQRPHGGLPGTAGSCLRASGAPGQA